MAAKVELKRRVASRQLKTLSLQVQFDGTGGVGVLAAAGPDAKFVSQIDKIATGQYRIIFTQSFEQNLWPSAIETAEGFSAKIVAVAKDRITFTTVDFAGADADAAAIYVNLKTFDHRFFY